MNSEEVWVEHSSGLYVSNKGKVFAPKSGKHPEHYTFGSNDVKGYKQVMYKGKTYKVHRLVAECFIPNPNNLPQVNHKDENKVNNNIDNLEWCDTKYNINYGSRTERATKNRDYKVIAEKLSKKILQMTLDGEIVKEWESVNECGRNGFKTSSVSNCCNNKMKTHKGYKWKWGDC